MPFVPIHLLPLLDPRERDRFQRRWEDQSGHENAERVANAIASYGREDFLDRNCSDLIGLFLEHDRDLRGFYPQGKQIVLERADNFKGTDFRYAQFYNSTIEQATFMATFDFARLYNVHFKKCGFHFSSFYGATLTQVTFEECEFIQGCRFLNAEFRESKFLSCFFHQPMFVDCSFDGKTLVEDVKTTPASGFNVAFDDKDEAELLRGIAGAYLASGAIEEADTTTLAAARAKTRSFKGLDWLWKVLVGELTGYGVRPSRPLLAIVVMLAIASMAFGDHMGFERGMGFAAGALFFAASTDELTSLPWSYRIAYVAVAFLSVTFLTVWITSAYAYFLSRR